MARTSSIHGSLRESVGLRGYSQKDPLIEYKNEGYDMFLEMMTNMRRNVIYSMFMFQPKLILIIKIKSIFNHLQEIL